MEEELEKAATLIKHSKSAVAFTGAGISVESGIPDFRSPGGLWSKFDPNIYCDYDKFKARPELFWDMSREMQAHMVEAKPNPAHIALSDMQKQGFLSCVITQNVDKLHQQAGSTTVFELHGNAATSTCTMCREKVDTPSVIMQLQDKEVKVPRCRICDGVMKLNVVLFGEPLESSTMEGAMAAAKTADVILVVGTSLTVSPANLIVDMCQRRKGRVIMVDPDQNITSKADVFLCGKAGELLPRLFEACLALHNISS